MLWQFRPAVIIILLGVLIYGGIAIRNNQKPVVEPTRVEIPKKYFPYQRPSISVKRSYLTVLVGDSVIAALGRNANQLRMDLIALYPANEFVNYNYGFSSTNILSVSDRLHKQTTDRGEIYPPINEQTFDLIIFESFANNPLSQYPLAEGLNKQTEILEISIKSVIDRHPGSVIAIMVPIALSEEHYAKGVNDLSPDVRKQWVQERVSYINNAIAFARQNNIPLINVYEKSLTSDGKVNLKYVDPRDYIHPSKEGIKLISQTIADFIYQNHIFPESDLIP